MRTTARSALPSVATRWPSTRTPASTSLERFQTITSAPGGMTSGRACSECAATYVSAIASRPHMSTGPPFERLYAVDPDGVEQMSPSHGCRPSASPPTARSSSIMRPSEALATTTSFTATPLPPGCSSSRVGSSTTSYSPAKTRARPSSRSRFAIELRKPTRPKLTPTTGTPCPRKRVSARSTVPSPPSTTARSARLRSAVASNECFSASSDANRSSTPCSCATACRRASPEPICARWPWVTTAARVTARGLTDGVGNPEVDVIGIRFAGSMHEVDEELPVPLRAGQA